MWYQCNFGVRPRAGGVGVYTCKKIDLLLFARDVGLNECAQ